MQYYILSRGRSVDLLGGVDLDVVNAGRIRYSLDGYDVLACAQKDGGESEGLTVRSGVINTKNCSYTEIR